MGFTGHMEVPSFKDVLSRKSSKMKEMGGVGKGAQRLRVWKQKGRKALSSLQI